MLYGLPSSMGGPEDCHPFHLLCRWYRPCARQYGHIYTTSNTIINATSVVMLLLDIVLSTLRSCSLDEIPLPTQLYLLCPDDEARPGPAPHEFVHVRACQGRFKTSFKGTIQNVSIRT